MELGSRLASGATADVFVLDAGRVAKRFPADTPEALVASEAAATRLATATDVRAPAVHDVTRVDGQPVIVLERIEGESMLAALGDRPWRLWHHARGLADLQASLHEATDVDLRPLRQRVRADIEATALDSRTRDRVLAALDDLPTGTAFLHGDLHPGNVIRSPEGPVLIDWRDASVGHPAADVARTALLLRFSGRAGSSLHPVGSALRWLFRRAYLRAYCRRTGVSRRLVRRWELPVAAARLTEDVAEYRTLRLFVASRVARTTGARAAHLEG